MFTRMSKVMLWIAGIGIVIGGFVAMGNDEEGIGWAIWVIGFVALWALGVFIELINNVLDIKNILSNMSLGNSYASNSSSSTPKNSYNTTPIYTNWCCTGCGTTNVPEADFCSYCGKPKGSLGTGGYNISELAAESETQNTIQDGWFCRSCGTKNKSTSRICSGCGKDK